MQTTTKSSNGVFRQYSNGVLVINTMRPAYLRNFNAQYSTTGNRKDPNGQTFSILEEKYPQGVITYRNTTSSSRLEGCVGSDTYHHMPSSVDISLPVATRYNKALDKFYDKVRNSDLNLAVDIAGRRQLYAMLGGFARNLTSLPKAFGLLVKSLRYSPSKAMGNAWLKYQYGIRPAMDTAYGLAQFARSHMQKIKIKSRSTSKVVQDFVTKQSGYYPNVHRHIQSSHRIEIGATYVVSDPQLFDSTRLTSLNPAAIAWELVPYSFVIDWFVDIGGYLQAYENSMVNGLTFLNGYTTHTSMTNMSGSHYGSWTYAGWSCFSYTTFSRVEKGKSRVVMTSFPKPVTPSFKISLGASRVMSAVALLNQFRR